MIYHCTKLYFALGFTLFPRSGNERCKPNARANLTKSIHNVIHANLSYYWYINSLLWVNIQEQINDSRNIDLKTKCQTHNHLISFELTLWHYEIQPIINIIKLKTKIKVCLWNTMPPGATESEKIILSTKVKVKVTRSLLKLTTDKQTGQKQYVPDHSIRGIKITSTR